MDVCSSYLSGHHLLCLIQLVYCLLLKSLWFLEGMVHASGFPAASLLSGCVVLYSPLAAGALLWEGCFLSSHTHKASGLHPFLGFHHCVCVVTLQAPQFFALYCSLVSSIDWLSHVYLKGALTVRG